MSDQSDRVLLIEDNPGDADLVRLRLIEHKPKVNVSCVQRLSDGLASLEDKPAVILLDLNLPDSQGAETFRKVLEKAPGIPVVILSGQEDEALAIKAIHEGAQDYLVKGAITGGELDRAMRHAMERQALLRSLEISRKQQLEFKDKFLSHVSHELRTPLTCIHQYVTILLDGLAGEVNPEQHGHLTTILKSVNQLGAMVHDLLEATRAESGKIRLERRCVSVDGIMGVAVDMMRATARDKHVGLELSSDATIPFVHGDPDRILEVLINLIDNAVKFTPPDGMVTVQAFRVPTDPEFVSLAVTDTGCGIHPEARSLIFERLYQDPESPDNSRKGLGLGLFIARELVRLHGGRIWLASQPGEGSTFSFTLPLYSLSKLLLPAITNEGRLRESFVLVRFDLRPHSKPARGNWKEICSQALEKLERCVYLDKDLVLPPMAMPGPEQAFFVVASTDMDGVEIMMKRIREQMAKLEDLIANGNFEVSASAIAHPNCAPQLAIVRQVQEVADSVTTMVRTSLAANRTHLQLKSRKAHA